MARKAMAATEEIKMRTVTRPGAARSTTGIRLDPAQEARIENVRLALENQYGGYLSKSAAVRHLIDLGLRTYEARQMGLPSAMPRAEQAQFRVAEVRAVAANRFAVEYPDTVVMGDEELAPECASGAFVAFAIPSNDLAPAYQTGDIALLELGAEPTQRASVVVVFGGEIMVREWIATPSGIVLGASSRDALPVPVPRPIDVRVAGVLGKVVRRAEGSE